MLRTALAALLALASVWEGPVALPSDDHFNDTFHGFLNGTIATAFRRDEIYPGGCPRAVRPGNLSSPIGPGLTGLAGVDVGQMFEDILDVNMSLFPPAMAADTPEIADLAHLEGQIASLPDNNFDCGVRSPGRSSHTLCEYCHGSIFPCNRHRVTALTVHCSSCF